MGAYNFFKTARYFAGGGSRRAAAEELLANASAKPALPPGRPPQGAKPAFKPPSPGAKPPARPPLKPATQARPPAHGLKPPAPGLKPPAKFPLKPAAKPAPKSTSSLAFSIVSSAPVTAALFIIAASFFGKPAPHATAPELALIGLIFIGGFGLLPGAWEYKTGASKQLMVKGAARYKYYKVAAIGDLIAAVLFFLAGAQVLALFALSLVVVTAVFALITLEWNISIHLGALSSIATAALFEFGRQSWWLFLLIVPVALMRVERKAHTYGQVVAGALLPIVITWFVFSAFGVRVG